MLIELPDDVKEAPGFRKIETMEAIQLIVKQPVGAYLLYESESNKQNENEVRSVLLTCCIKVNEKPEEPSNVLRFTIEIIQNEDNTYTYTLESTLAKALEMLERKLIRKGYLFQNQKIQALPAKNKNVSFKCPISTITEISTENDKKESSNTTTTAILTGLGSNSTLLAMPKEVTELDEYFAVENEVQRRKIASLIIDKPTGYYVLYPSSLNTPEQIYLTICIKGNGNNTIKCGIKIVKNENGFTYYGSDTLGEAIQKIQDELARKELLKGVILTPYVEKKTASTIFTGLGSNSILLEMPQDITSLPEYIKVDTKEQLLEVISDIKKQPDGYYVLYKSFHPLKQIDSPPKNDTRQKVDLIVCIKGNGNNVIKCGIEIVKNTKGFTYHGHDTLGKAIQKIQDALSGKELAERTVLTPYVQQNIASVNSNFNPSVAVEKNTENHSSESSLKRKLSDLSKTEELENKSANTGSPPHDGNKFEANKEDNKKDVNEEPDSKRTNTGSSNDEENFEGEEPDAEGVSPQLTRL